MAKLITIATLIIGIFGLVGGMAGGNYLFMLIGFIFIVASLFYFKIIDRNKNYCRCQKCGYTWDKRKRVGEPAICPKCKSDRWNITKRQEKKLNL